MYALRNQQAMAAHARHVQMPMMNSLFTSVAAERDTETMKNTIERVSKQSRKHNTAACYDPKINEYYGFCDHRYHNTTLDSRYTVTSEKLFHFLFYQAMRNKYERGGKKRKQPHGFDCSDYDAVINRYNEYDQMIRAGVLDQVPDPDDPVGYETVTTYKSVILNIWKGQVRRMDYFKFC